MGNDMTSRQASAEAASKLAAFSDPSALGDHLDFTAFIASARKAREARGVSVSEVAERMGVDHATVSRLESAQQANPTVNTVVRYVEAIGLRVAWGLAERDDRPIPRGEGRERRRVRSAKPAR